MDDIVAYISKNFEDPLILASCNGKDIDNDLLDRASQAITELTKDI